MNNGFEKPQDIKPGEFRENTEPVPRPEEHALQLEASKSLIARFAVIKKELNPKADIIYYPSCHVDTSISQAFPESRIVYVDIDEKAVNALRKAGLEAYKEDALMFKPDGPVDILLMLNPSISPEKPLETLADEGYMLCNDYHGTATKVRMTSEYELVGIVRVKDRQTILDTENPEDYWKDIDSEEEFKQAPFSFGAVYYKTAQKVVERLTGAKENVLERYKQIIAEAREQTRMKREALVKSQPELAQFRIHDEQDDLLQYDRGQDEPVMIDTRLPRKKGTVDDLFIFKKRRSPLETTA
jgi:hypothetical protein